MESLIVRLDSPLWRDRSQAAARLAALGPASRPALPRLKALLADSEERPLVRAQAARCLVEIAPESRGTLEALREALRGEDSAIASDAALLLGRLGRRARPAAPDLAALLEAPDSQLRYAAVSALDQIGPGREAADPLIRLLEDPSPLTRMKAVSALGKITPAGDPVVEALARAARDRDLFVRRGAREALRRIGTPEARRALETLSE